MNMTVILLLASFVAAVIGLFIFIGSMSHGLFGNATEGAHIIFAPQEENLVEEPAATAAGRARLQAVVQPQAPAPLDDAELAARLESDRSSAGPALLCLSFAVFWLMLGSFAGLVSSIKLHAPDWLTANVWLTFGRIRPAHLNMVIYGWSSCAGIGIALWLIPRLLKTRLAGVRYAYAGALLWNIGVAAGIVAILSGYSAGMEWLEFPPTIAALLIAGGALLGIPLLQTLQQRRVKHLYVSVWYMSAALLWFPVLYTVANVPDVHFGIEQATMNWWYGHNVLGLWFTPLGLAAAYYFIPKVLGKPIYSYHLSLLGFWALAFFYSQVGGHHLIGGPVPTWLITLSIVQSVMMVIPVFAVAINQHMTMTGHFDALRHSPTLRFIVLGAMMYTLASVQGSLESLRAVNSVTHFTHFTVAHAHLGLYGFFAMVMFGSIYFVMPRIVEREWPSAVLISLHFWLVVGGFAIYFIGLSIGGWLQGMIMLDAKRPFMDSVSVTLPYLEARSIGGTMMTLGHLVFASHFTWMLVRRTGCDEFGAPRFGFRRAQALSSGVSA